MTLFQDSAKRKAFILSHTAIRSPPLVPEIDLLLAEEITPLWEATNDAFREAEHIALPPPYWAFCWPGGQAVARYILDNPGLVSGRKVLAFAAGGGLEAIAAAKAHAASVDSSDIDPFAFDAQTMNAALNGVRVNAFLGDVVGVLDQGWEVILAGDVFYEEPMARSAWPWLRDAHRAGAAVYLGDPGRTYLPSEGLIAVQSYDVPVKYEVESRHSWNTTVYQIEP